ncbi:MAG: J domain-containing protein [Deltaproteobacteria bacterium]|nr:J domain-containing protein [Deltaproteobacteria bacterium]
MKLLKYLEILGLQEGAKPDDIKKAFRDLAFQYHPDRNPGSKAAEDQFKKIAEAYAYLTDNAELLHAIHRPQANTSKNTQFYSDIFDELFGVQAQSTVQKGKDVFQVAELSLKEAFLGKKETFVYWRELRCEKCLGLGAAAGKKSPTCSYCFGLGNIQTAHRWEKIEKKCPKCLGLGRIPQDPCKKCRGKGLLPHQEKLNYLLPPKVRHGQEIRVVAKGSFAPRAASAGDLVIQIYLKKEASFTFDGPNVLCEVSISPEKAAQGGSLIVPTLMGEREIELVPGQKGEAVYSIKDYGLGGDQFVIVQVKNSKRLQK